MMNAKDLLDFNKMEEIKSRTDFLRKVGVDEETQTRYVPDNFAGLNQLDQEGSLKDYNKEQNEKEEQE